MKKILVPVDYSASSLSAALYAGSLGAKIGAEVFLLHGYHVPVQLPDMPISMMENAVGKSEEGMKSMLSKLKEIGKWSPGKEPVFKPAIREGLAVDLIVEMAKEEGIDLIVMGTMGAKGIEEVLFGTHTTTVIKRTGKPVLTLPAEAIYSDIERIVFATDWMTSDSMVLEQLVSLAEALQATIDVVHVIEPDEKYHPEVVEAQKAKLAVDLHYSKITYHIVEAESVIDGIEDYLESSDAKLVAMFTHKRNFLTALFNPSLTRSMAMHTHIPLLAIHG